MRRLIIFLLVLGSTYSSKAQNLLGWDKASVIKFMVNQDSTKFLGEDYNKDYFAYDSFSRSGGMMVYYFDKTNRCIEYRKFGFMKELLVMVAELYRDCKPLNYDQFVDEKNKLLITIAIPEDGNGMFTVTYDSNNNK